MFVGRLTSWARNCNNVWKQDAKVVGISSSIIKGRLSTPCALSLISATASRENQEKLFNWKHSTPLINRRSRSFSPFGLLKNLLTSWYDWEFNEVDILIGWDIIVGDIPPYGGPDLEGWGRRESMCPINKSTQVLSSTQGHSLSDTTLDLFPSLHIILYPGGCSFYLAPNN